MGENKNKFPLDEEKVLDFEVAKDLTIEEAVKKHKEIEAGVTEDDSLLDRYIKQHREEIESQKFETKANHLPLIETMVDEGSSPSDELTEEIISVSEEIDPMVEGFSETSLETLEETVAASVVAMDELVTFPDPSDLELEEEVFWEQEETGKKQIYFWSATGLLFVGVVASAFVWMNSVNKLPTTSPSTSSTSTSQTSSGIPSSSDTNVIAFEQLYKSFFTDSSLAKLKNSEFGKLTELRTLLDKIDKNSDSYKKVKEQYDRLEKAIAAVQAINTQFDKEVIVNGEMDTTATAKAGASLSATTTGIRSVDSLLASVVTFGRSQLEKASASATVASSESVNTGESTSVPATTGGTSVAENSAVAAAGTVSHFGIPTPAGVALQRDRSRVPYNQALIDDAANTAWVFGSGILENIVAISQQRGYITGHQYILEKVNIINGNGYYNMFKPDGTYLFSINCKTGYFVGNGAGHADALDY